MDYCLTCGKSDCKYAGTCDMFVGNQPAQLIEQNEQLDLTVKGRVDSERHIYTV